MPKCEHCADQVIYGKTVEGKIVVLDPLEIALHQQRKGKTQILTADGYIIDGFRVGDAYENGYVLGYVIHKCGRLEKDL